MTGLRWKRCVEGMVWDRDNCACVGKPREFSWEDLPNSSEWRVPTLEEAKTLLYCSNTKEWGKACKASSNDYFQNPTIDQGIFPNTPDWMWTVTEYEFDPEYVWFIGFYGGGAYYGSRDDSVPVRLVCFGA